MLENLKLENMEIKNGIYCANNIPDTSKIDMPIEGLDGIDIVNSTSFWHKHRTACIITAIKTFVPLQENQGFVDIGGGNGYNAVQLSNQGYPVILFEPTQNGVLSSKKRGVKNIVWGLFDSSTVKECSMPAVGLFDVLEHIEDDGKFVRDLHSLLSENGKVVATVPAHKFLWSAKDNYMLHHRRYSLKQFEELFCNNGFNIVYSTYFFSLLLPPMFFLKALPYRLFSKNKNHHSFDKFAKEHESVGQSIALYLLKFEQFLIKRTLKIPFGCSVLLVAQKSQG
ncbi:MAG: class I SAM-dependent methyltransferase [Defluviitaleaceae bacterium]|nr:class I SAM-dependent methyltransferase [Defluviitaleaceae bacterium]